MSSASATLNKIKKLFAHCVEVFFSELRGEGVEPGFEVEELPAFLVGLLGRVEPHLDGCGAFVLLERVEVCVEQLHRAAVFFFDAFGRADEDVGVHVLDEVAQDVLGLEAALEREAAEKAADGLAEEQFDHAIIVDSLLRRYAIRGASSLALRGAEVYRYPLYRTVRKRFLL